MNDTKMVVLIDAENTSANWIEQILKEVARYGTPYIKKAYGDWTKGDLNSWKDVVHKHAIQPIQQFRYVKGKNAADGAMIVDAMDILYTDRFGVFCIVSSDSDYTRLAIRLSESGVTVVGVGKRETKEPLRMACRPFIEIENIIQDSSHTESTEESAKIEKTSSKPKTEDERRREKCLHLLLEAFDAVEKDGTAHLADMGNYVYKIRSDFDSRTYGHRKITPLVESYKDVFQVKRVKNPGGTDTVLVTLAKSPSKKTTKKGK